MTNNIMVKQSSVKDVCDIVPLHKQFMWSGILKDSNAFKNNGSYSPSDMSPYTGTYRKHCCENPKSYDYHNVGYGTEHRSRQVLIIHRNQASPSKGST